MKSRLPKVLHPICGRPMLAYVIDAAREATGEKPLVVYSPATEQIRELFADEADFALQAEPRGTGDALVRGVDALGTDIEEVVVLSGDGPLDRTKRSGTWQLSAAQRGAAMALAVIDQAGPYAHAYGRIEIQSQDARGEDRRSEGRAGTAHAARARQRRSLCVRPVRGCATPWQDPADRPRRESCT